MGRRSRRKRSRDSDESDEDARLSDEYPDMSQKAKRVSDEELTSQHAILDAVGPHAEQDTAASAHGVPAALQSFVGHALLGEYGSVGAANAGPMEALHAAAAKYSASHLNCSCGACQSSKVSLRHGTCRIAMDLCVPLRYRPRGRARVHVRLVQVRVPHGREPRRP